MLLPRVLRQHRSQAHLVRAVAAYATVVITALVAVLSLGACDRLRPDENRPTAPAQGEAGGIAPANRPDLPLRGPGLASLAVLPLTDVPLQVLSTQPSDGAVDVPTAAGGVRIAVRFNHPVVPLVPIEDESRHPSPLHIEPRVSGIGRWLDTSTYLLEPEADLRAGTEYTVVIDQDLTDVLGSRLNEPVMFRFTAANPSVLSTSPGDRALAGATQSVSVTFNMAMDRPSVERAFTIARDDDGRAVSGSLRWASRSVEFVPKGPFERGATYVATVSAGATAADSQAHLTDDHTWRFTIAPSPEVVRTDPADGEGASTRMRRGDLKISFNTPMRTDGLTVTLQPTITNPHVWWDEGDRVARIGGGWLASRAYTATIPAGTASLYGDTLAKDVVVRFTLAPLEPTITLRTPRDFGVHPATEPQVVYLDAVNSPAATLSLHSIDATELLDVTVAESRQDQWSRLKPGDEQLVRRWTVSTADDVDVIRRVSTTLAADGQASLPPGVYLLLTDHGGRYIAAVSHLNLTLKHTPTEVLVWATDLESGAPVHDVPIAVYEEPSVALAAGRTGTDGVFRATFEQRHDSWRPLLAVSVRDDRVEAAVGSNWNDGLDPWAFNLNYDPEQRPYYGNIYTDRPVYRAGQQAYFRAVLRADDDAVYRLPDLDSVHVTVRDPQYELVLDADLTLSPFGTVNGDIPLSAAARLGDYHLEVTVPEGSDVHGGRQIASTTFRVAAYRKPEFEVAVTTELPAYADGDTIRTSVAATYYFGGAVAGATVQWRLLSDDYFFRPDIEGRWDFIDYDLIEDRYYDAQGEIVAEGAGTLDGEGRLAFDVPADLSEYPLSQVFTLDVEVTDINHQVVAGRTSAVVHKSEAYVGLRPVQYLGGAGEPMTFDVLALDPDADPIDGQEVELTFAQRHWYSVKEKREDGAFYWTSHYTDTLIAESTVAVDALGKAQVSFTPRAGGVHRVEATTRDAKDRPAQSATYAWVTGRRFVNWRQENNDRIALVSDKKSYAPGDIAEVLIPAPFANSTALLTIERGTIRDVRVLELPGNSETVRVPILKDYAPNVYLSIVLVKGMQPDSPVAQLKVGYVNLPVSTHEKQLSIAVRADRETPYAPRETVSYVIRATDVTGNPVQAELSVALVDKALLALSDDHSTPLVDAFYGQRALAVGTAASLVNSAQRLNKELAAEKKGGGGGLTGVGTVRRLFRDTAYWNGAVTTDENGEARLRVDLPDNLTTWRLDVRGITGDETLVGTAEHHILTSKPLLVRPVMPRFVVVGDALQLETVVNNATDHALDTVVSLATVGLELEGASDQALSVPSQGKGKVVWSVRVSGEDVNSPGIPGAYGEATVQMRVAGGNYEDSVEMPLPVYQFSDADVVTTAGEVRDGVVIEHIEVPTDAIRSMGDLALTLHPSLAAASRDSLTWLESFPYECSEQTASKFIPNVATFEVVAELAAADLTDDLTESDDSADERAERGLANDERAERGLANDERAELYEALGVQVAAGLQRLYALQHSDGGWGWWSTGRSQPWLTAYALYGLQRAETAGFAVSEEALVRAQQFLMSYLNDTGDRAASLNTRAFAAFVLGEGGQLSPSRAVSLYDYRADMSIEGKAFLALALAQAGDEQRPRVDGLLADIGGAADASASGSFWPEGGDARLSMGDETRTTAIVILALSRLDPENVNLVPALRWLMAQRHAARWETTQSTAWSLIALSERMRATGELDADYTFAAELNDAVLVDGTVTAANVDHVLAATVPMAELNTVHPNELAIRRNGVGLLYYTSVLRAYRPAEVLEPVDRGFAIGRQYFATDPVTFEAKGQAIDRAAIGDVVQVKLTIIVPERRNYVIVEDPLPAGFEIVDTSLKTTSAAAQAPQFMEVAPEDVGEAPWWERSWWSYWVESQRRDEKAALFATELGAGTYEYTYLIRAGVAGNFHAIPARAEEMYRPEVFGRSAGGVFTVDIQ